MRELRKGIRLKFLNRDVAVDGNVRESGDVGGNSGESYPEVGSSGWKSTARCVVSGAFPAALENPEDRVSKVNSLWSMEQCRQGKSAKWIRNFGKRISPKGWARGSPFRTRRLLAGCLSFPRASNCQLRTGTDKGNPTIPTGLVYHPAKPLQRERAWQNLRGKKTLLSLTLVRLCEMT
ncbi:hypothetical protein YC2023_066023 [Brassica napus]